MSDVKYLTISQLVSWPKSNPECLKETHSGV